MLPLTMILMAATLWFVFDDPTIRERFWRALSEHIWRRPDNLLIIAATPFVLLYLAVEQPARLQDRLVIDAHGIHFQRPARFLLPLTPRAWSIPWSRLKQAQLKSLGPAFFLVLNDGARRRRVIMDEWALPQTPWETAKLLLKQRQQRQRRRPAPEAALRLAEQLPLWQALRAHGVSIQLPDGSSALLFDLTKNRHATSAVILFAVIALYGFLDFLLFEETYAGFLPWTAWTLTGVIVAVLAYRWLSCAKLPFVIAIGLALMLGVGSGLAMYPGLLRLNQLTDAADKAQAHEYVLSQSVQWEPLETGLPAIQFEQPSEYWRQFKPGSRYTFYLRHGGLGFYQLDRAPIYAETREFYEKRDQSGASAQ